ncbi:uncharacterized protein I303_106491 [Kwoniella dejecticola CBS 10117]|uniref:Nucleoporin Nup188 N-terminal subdomain III domain-containing protein n=1 Tax=Kwoniella dejecticola CBS 10117 TaxID=1296121 RepID=A0A1A5ZUK3_9TREE|nr:uncharacterized protein I303_08251 [Kwoniella dejecticola CBS 10117]OBR81481.1 hypothetical protein I303_08251 [Kwoniella dejecticola CBS 10117]
MVQPQAGPSNLMEADDYLCPLTTIRDTLQKSDPSSIYIPKLTALLSYHEKKLTAPWAPFDPPSAKSKAAISKASFSLPYSEVQFSVDEKTRSLAAKLTEILNINEISSYLLISSYDTFSINELTEDDEQDMILERVLLWYSEEILALPQIILTLLKLSNDNDIKQTSLGDLASGFVVDIIGEDTSAYIESLFRNFSMLAQRSLDDKQRGSTSLFWATHQLRLQEQYLNLLFVLLIQSRFRPSIISEGLIKSAIMSSFGTSQANREIWETDYECTEISTRIRDLMLIIALEALCLSEIVSPQEGNLSDDEAMQDRIQDTLLHDKSKIESIHHCIIDYSNDLTPHHPEPDLTSTPLPIWPMSIICLAWSIVLRSLPQDRLPTNDHGVTWQDMAIRGLRLPSGLFPWLEVILSGPLLGSDRDTIPDSGAMDVGLFLRKVLKDLLVGLSELVQLESIADRPGLYRSWELLFGGGSPSNAAILSADYWIDDFPYQERRSVLDRSQYPYQPTHVLRLLSSLVGSPTADNPSEEYGTDPAAQVHHYFTNLPTITLTVESSWCKYVGKDENGKETVESTKSLILPGGGSIPKGSRGFIVGAANSSQVMWTNQIISGWPLFLEILQAASGLKSLDERARGDSASPTDTVYLSVRDLGIQSDTTEILAAGLQFLHSILHSSTYIKATVLTHLSPDGQFTSGQRLLHLALTILQHSRNNELSFDASTISQAIDLIQSLITSPESNVWPALRSSGFFDATGKKRGSVVALIQADSTKGEHTLTASVLRLVLTLVKNADHIPDSDTILLRSALHLVFSEIWSNFSAWRYKDVAKKYELSSLLVGIFDTILSHPLAADGNGPTPAAQVLIDLFVTSTSPLTYRPLVDAITQASYLIPRLIGSRRNADAELVATCLDETLSFVATLFRVSSMMATSAMALPKSLCGLPVALPSRDKVQLVDALFEIAVTPAAQVTNVLNIVKTVRVYLEVISQDPHKPSLASMLRNPNETCEKLTELAAKADDPDVRSAVWDLLSTIVSTQPGCVSACIGRPEGDQPGSTLKAAVEEITNWTQSFKEAPHTLSAVLSYLQSIMRSAGADKAIANLRKNSEFWQGVFDLSTRIVPAPPSFSLSMHSEDFTYRIQKYAHSVQAKANATSLLSSELSYALNNDNEDEPETKARTLVLSLFRNNSALQEASLMSTHSSCVPELHEEQSKKIVGCGGNLGRLKTVKLSSEREYGRDYLYDGSVIVPSSTTQQSTVNLALDLLNLNWSMLDADIALTRSFRQLAESISVWTEGDSLAINAALRAAVAISETVAEEYRGGDVMLAIQVERLSILAILLETALDAEESRSPDSELIKQLSTYMALIVNSQTFPPIVSLRHPHLPTIHQPVLRILYLLLQAISSSETTTSNVSTRESLVDASTIFVLESADIAFEAVIKGSTALPDSATSNKGQSVFAGNLSMIIGVICELSKLASGANSNTSSLWLDKVQGFNLIGRSLEVLVRTRVVNDRLPLHISSILLLHLALAENPTTCEKLAISGLLPSYSDNAIIVQAEHGNIVPPSSFGLGNSTHDAWCGMLLVVKALLSTLPDTLSFAKNDVIPFIRVVNQQILSCLSWDGETPISLAALTELELITDVFYGIASALEVDSATRFHGIMQNYSISAIELLKNINYALSHPRLLSTLFIHASEEERFNLEAELRTIGDQDESGSNTNLFDFEKTPIIASRSTFLLRVIRNISLTIIKLTKSWEILSTSQEELDERSNSDLERLILSVAEHNDTHDPIEIINDIYTNVANITTVSSSNDDTEAGYLSKIQNQILETSSLIASTQLLLRHSLLPEHEKRVDQENMDLDSDVSPMTMTSKPRRQSSGGHANAGSKESLTIRELQNDLQALLARQSGMRGVIRSKLEKVFGTDD